MAKSRAPRLAGRKKAGRGTNTRVGSTQARPRGASAVRQPVKQGSRKEKGTSTKRAAPKKPTPKKTTKRVSIRKSPARKTAARKSSVQKLEGKKTSAQMANRKKRKTRNPPSPQVTAVRPPRRPVKLSSARKVPALDRVRKIAINEDLLPAQDVPPSVDRTPR